MLSDHEIESFIINLFENDISPALSNHSGNCEVLAINIEEKTLTVMISYGGSCASCPSNNNTLEFITNYLREELQLKEMFKGEINVVTTSDFEKDLEDFKNKFNLDLE